MYVPAHFAEDRIPVLHEAIRGFGLTTLVTLTSGGLIASHLPVSYTHLDVYKRQALCCAARWTARC